MLSDHGVFAPLCFCVLHRYIASNGATTSPVVAVATRTIVIYRSGGMTAKFTALSNVPSRASATASVQSLANRTSTTYQTVLRTLATSLAVYGVDVSDISILSPTLVVNMPRNSTWSVSAVMVVTFYDPPVMHTANLTSTNLLTDTAISTGRRSSTRRLTSFADTITAGFIDSQPGNDLITEARGAVGRGGFASGVAVTATVLDPALQTALPDIAQLRLHGVSSWDRQPPLMQAVTQQPQARDPMGTDAWASMQSHSGVPEPESELAESASADSAQLLQQQLYEGAGPRRGLLDALSDALLLAANNLAAAVNSSQSVVVTNSTAIINLDSALLASLLAIIQDLNQSSLNFAVSGWPWFSKLSVVS